MCLRCGTDSSGAMCTHHTGVALISCTHKKPRACHTCFYIPCYFSFLLLYHHCAPNSPLPPHPLQVLTEPCLRFNEAPVTQLDTPSLLSAIPRDVLYLVCVCHICNGKCNRAVNTVNMVCLEAAASWLEQHDCGCFVKTWSYSGSLPLRTL